MLTLISKFDPALYPKFVPVSIEGANVHSVQRRMGLAEFQLNLHGVHDFYIFNDKKFMTFYFRTVREQMIGQGCLFPDIGAQFPFIEIKKTTPTRLMEIASTLERTFNNAGKLRQDVRLLVHADSHTIDALVKNGPDIIQVMKWSEKLQAKYTPA